MKGTKTQRPLTENRYTNNGFEKQKVVTISVSSHIHTHKKTRSEKLQLSCSHFHLQNRLVSKPNTIWTKLFPHMKTQKKCANSISSHSKRNQPLWLLQTELYSPTSRCTPRSPSRTPPPSQTDCSRYPQTRCWSSSLDLHRKAFTMFIFWNCWYIFWSSWCHRNPWTHVKAVNKFKLTLHLLQPPRIPQEENPVQDTRMSSTHLDFPCQQEKNIFCAIPQMRHALFTQVRALFVKKNKQKNKTACSYPFQWRRRRCRWSWPTPRRRLSQTRSALWPPTWRWSSWWSSVTLQTNTKIWEIVTEAYNARERRYLHAYGRQQRCTRRAFPHQCNF